MSKSFISYALIILSGLGCNLHTDKFYITLLKESPSIQGKSDYLQSPYVTAGDRVYMVGHQDGSFPELGWHIEGEMGGVWDHPIKLMDGFDIDLIWEDEILELKSAQNFINYPMANFHLFTNDSKNIEVERWQFVPDHKEAIHIQLVLKNNGPTAEKLELQFIGNADLRPTWLGERTQMIDSRDIGTYDQTLDAWIVKDSINNWFVVFGGDTRSEMQQSDTSHYSGKGISATLGYPLSIPGHSTEVINFTIAGSYHSADHAIASYIDVKENYFSYLEQKNLRYQELATKSKLTIPDKNIQEAFEWLKYNSDWLVRTIPEIGTGIMAGIPDYPWWFGVDSEYALKGYMAIGQKDIALSTIDLLHHISEKTNGNGRIVHEVSTNGAVFNPGNINETPQFASLIWEVYKWTGDRAFLEKYFGTIEKGMRWLLDENDENKNLFPEGFGMMEIHGLDSEMIDVACYTQRAFEDAAQMAYELDKKDIGDDYSKKAELIKERINKEFWSEEFNSFADFIGTNEQALRLVDDAIERAEGLKKPWAVEELQQTKLTIQQNMGKLPRPFVMHHNWVVNTPMEMNIATNDKALKALETAAKFVNPFGVFVTGIDRDDSAGSDDGSFKGTKAFSYTGAVMTLPTGVQIVGENNYGRVDKSLDYLRKMTRSFSYALPGSMYEVSPDYGMMTQAWNIYSYAVPIVHQFFGIHPNATKKEIRITPQMPQEWKEASIENVEIGDTNIDVFYERTDNRIWVKAIKYDPTWSMEIAFPSDGISNIRVIDGDLLKTEQETRVSAIQSTIEVYFDKE